MRNGDTKLFNNNPKLLKDMLEMRRAGLSVETLAYLFRCDRSSIRYQCKKHNVKFDGGRGVGIMHIQRPIIELVQKMDPRNKWTIGENGRILSKENKYDDYRKYPDQKSRLDDYNEMKAEYDKRFPSATTIETKRGRGRPRKH